MVEVFILLGLMLVNGIFVMGEIALVSARKTKLELLANKGSLRARAALKLMENPEVFLSTAQIVISLVTIITGLYSGEKFSAYLKPYLEKIAWLQPYAASVSIAIVVIIVTFLTIIIGELLPKRIGLIRAEKIAMIAAQPMLLISRIAFPIVWLLNYVTRLFFKLFGIQAAKESAVTEEEIKDMIKEGTEHGDIDQAEQQIIERVFHLGDRNITSLMTHRSDIIWMEWSGSMADLQKKVQNNAHSIYPLCDGNIDNIKGIIQLKNVILAEKDTPVASYLRPAVFVPENNSPYQVMEKFKQTKIHSAFIVDEYGTMQGMITLNDILEALVGDIPEHGDDDYEITQRKDGSYLVDAQLPFYNFLAKLNRESWMEGDQEYDTMGGFIIHHLQRIPAPTDTFIWRGFTFEIIDMDGARIDKILVTMNEKLKEEFDAEQ